MGVPMKRNLLFMTVLTLAACSGEPEPAADPTRAAGAVEAPPGPVATVTLAASTAPAPSPTAETGKPAAMPAAMHGRFGMVPADCTTRMGDDKGLLTVSAEGLRFYESVARPAAGAVITPETVKGRFAYSGEGMEWTRQVSLVLKDAGRTLVLEEFGEDAVSGPRTYRRCAA